MLTRRNVLSGGAATAAGWWVGGRTMADQGSARDAVDHLLLGVSHLEHGIAWLEALTGVKAQPGGSHPGVGTRNALVSLGRRQYLEIIAPDPAQSTFGFQIDVRKLPSPRLITWAASGRVDQVAAAARAGGMEVFGPVDGSRVRPDGRTLQWRTVGVQTAFAAPDSDPVPFFIEWAPDSRHPSIDAPAGCRLATFAIAHPQPARLHDALALLGIATAVARSDQTSLVATLSTPKGVVTLR